MSVKCNPPQSWGYNLTSGKTEPKSKNKALLEIKKSNINDYTKSNSPKDIIIINLHISNNTTPKIKTNLNRKVLT